MGVARVTREALPLAMAEAPVRGFWPERAGTRREGRAPASAEGRTTRAAVRPRAVACRALVAVRATAARRAEPRATRAAARAVAQVPPRAALAPKPTDPECADAVVYDEDLYVSKQYQVDALPLIYSAGKIWVQDFVENLQRFKCLTQADTFTIDGGDVLTNVSGLERLQNVNNDFIVEGRALTSIASLSALRTVGGSFSVYDTGLIDLQGLEGFSSARHLQVSGNPFLKSVKGLGVVQTDWLDINSNFALPNLDGMVVQHVGLLEIALNEALTTVGSLGAHVNTSGVSIHDNDVLSSISLRGLESATDLEIQDNPSLREIDDFGSVRPARHARCVLQSAAADAQRAAQRQHRALEDLGQ